MWRLPETNLCVSYLVVPGTEAKDTGDYPVEDFHDTESEASDAGDDSEPSRCGRTDASPGVGVVGVGRDGSPSEYTGCANAEPVNIQRDTPLRHPLINETQGGPRCTSLQSAPDTP